MKNYITFVNESYDTKPIYNIGDKVKLIKNIDYTLNHFNLDGKTGRIVNIKKIDPYYFNYVQFDEYIQGKNKYNKIEDLVEFAKNHEHVYSDLQDIINKITPNTWMFVNECLELIEETDQYEDWDEVNEEYYDEDENVFEYGDIVETSMGKGTIIGYNGNSYLIDYTDNVKFNYFHDGNKVPDIWSNKIIGKGNKGNYYWHSPNDIKLISKGEIKPEDQYEDWDD